MHHAGVMHLTVTRAHWKSSRADPAAEYRHRNAQSDSAFDIDQLARISRAEEPHPATPSHAAITLAWDT
jgi:hypothetical protein